MRAAFPPLVVQRFLSTIVTALFDTMDGTHCCASCAASLQADDGHDLCPACLGIDHLRDGLSENPCMNCSYMPRALRVARLAQLTSGGDPSPAGEAAPPRRSRRRGESATAAPPKKKAKSDSALSSKVERLSAELAEMKSLLQLRQSDTVSEEAGVSLPSMPVLTREDDVLSLAASASQFFDDYDGATSHTSHVSEAASFSPSHSSLSDAGEDSMQSVLRMALDRLNMGVPQQAEVAPESAFFRRGRPPSTFTIPPSAEYLKELHACWRDPSALSRLSADGRTLAAMNNAAEAGLDHMPAVEPAIASLIVSPEEALRPTVRCPRPQCRVTDDLLTRTYNAGARAGRLGNSLAHLMFALSASLQEGSASADSVCFSDAALQAFALITRELGRMMSLLCRARRQVWLAQSPLTEACRKTLRGVPVEPGVLFGPAALEALDRTIQARETRQQLSGLSRSMPPPAGVRGPPAPPRTRSSPRVRPTADSYRQHVAQRRTDNEFRTAPPPPPRQAQAHDRPRRPPRAPKGHGARR